MYTFFLSFKKYSEAYPCIFEVSVTLIGLVGKFCLIELRDILLAYLRSDYGRNTWLLIIVIFHVSIFLALFDHFFEILRLLSSDSNKMCTSIENIETEEIVGLGFLMYCTKTKQDRTQHAVVCEANFYFILLISLVYSMAGFLNLFQTPYCF